MDNNWRIRLRRRFRPEGDPNLVRVRRRKAIVSAFSRRVTFLRLILLLVGYIWMVALPYPQLGRGIYIDENALQPGQVNTYWGWGDVHNSDRYLDDLERLRDSNATSEQRAQYLDTEFRKIGLFSSTQTYQFTSQDINGTNTYAILSSPRAPGVEAMIISASWLSRIDDGNGALNLRGVATVLALAKFLKQYSLWAKDLVFVVSDGYLDGMQAWLSAYHGTIQSNLEAERLEMSSGVVWTALNIDYPGHSFSHLGVFYEGLNGRLPNQDLMNSFHVICSRMGVPVVLYDHLDPRSYPDRRKELDWLPEWLPGALRNDPEVRAYAYNARNVWRHVVHQASGRGSGVHGLFHQFRIDAFTMFALPATGPHGFHALGRVVESTLRTSNNLLERLHASFFFYIMTAPNRFMKIGNFLPSAVLISVAMMFTGLKEWSDSGWTQETLRNAEKSTETQAPGWTRRPRPVLRALCIMISSHLLGVATYLLMNSGWDGQNSIGGMLVLTMACIFAFGVSAVCSKSDRGGAAPIASVLKALNLCFASTIISATTVLNFSLAASLAVFLGIPLSVSSTSKNLPLRASKFSLYLFLSLGWVLKHERLNWNWEIMGVWLLPFLWIVYFPLVLQAGIVCLL
ncbi:Gaa1-domain-containing protein [Dendrothele bispora CBS 962.96]|uniref:Gaa1-domain-containing protein n=1 Tax=Dendrothele bispora (strain CBS 962.96) TaxID=1314807 RepID=A0A4S8LE52_DENBC|nr:Gaa1-domain-containing protein [Dendrothele bispora CBS 962.96]